MNDWDRIRIESRTTEYKHFIPLLISFGLIFLLSLGCGVKNAPKPNVIFVFADQWRAQDIGYNGNSQVKTPSIDQFAKERNEAVLIQLPVPFHQWNYGFGGRELYLGHE